MQFSHPQEHDLPLLRRLKTLIRARTKRTATAAAMATVDMLSVIHAIILTPKIFYIIFKKGHIV